MSILLRSLVLLALVFLSFPGSAQWAYVDSLYPDPIPAGATGIRAGASVAVDRNADGSVRAVYVGVPRATVTRDGTTYPEAGVVEVWIPRLWSPEGGWHLHGVIEQTGVLAAGYGHYGAAVAAHRGLIVIGAPDYTIHEAHPKVGKVEYCRDQNMGISNLPDLWCLKGIFGTEDNARLGWSVSVDGEGQRSGFWGSWIALGSPYRNDRGCVRVEFFSFPDPDSSRTLNWVCGSEGSNLGASVAIRYIDDSKFLLAAGAPATTVAGATFAGEARVYVAPIPAYPSTPSLLQTLQAGDPAFLDAFGSSVALDGSRVFVGGTGRKKSGVGATGSVSVFKLCDSPNFCLESETFGEAAGELCGASLAADVHKSAAPIVAGCPGYEDGVEKAGSVLRLERVNYGWGYGWPATRIAMGALPHGGDDLGRSVAMGDGLIFAGAPLNDDAGTNNGVVRIFQSRPDLIFANGFD